MTIEYLSEKKNYYDSKRNYFNNIGFGNLAADFQGIVDLLAEMENYIKEKENGV